MEIPVQIILGGKIVKLIIRCYHLVSLGLLPLDCRVYLSSSAGLTFSRALLNILRMLRQIDETPNAGDHCPSYSIERQICPFEYICGCIGMRGLRKTTSGGSKG